MNTWGRAVTHKNTHRTLFLLALFHLYNWCSSWGDPHFKKWTLRLKIGCFHSKSQLHNHVSFHNVSIFFYKCSEFMFAVTQRKWSSNSTNSRGFSWHGKALTTMWFRTRKLSHLKPDLLPLCHRVLTGKQPTRARENTERCDGLRLSNTSPLVPSFVSCSQATDSSVRPRWVRKPKDAL